MTSRTIDVIKARGSRPTEVFDRDKLHHSIKSVLISERSYAGEAEDTASKVCAGVMSWLEERPEVTSYDLRRIASKHLSRYNPGAAYIYEHHRQTI